MHLTWQPGDPVIQLDFPNPLNVSVQIGDVAYFSNPNPVGQVQEWAATTTPHLSNPQSGVIMIGEIIQIIPWDGTVSSIICQMPQVLFNQYFAQIVEGGCVTNTVTTNTGTTFECATRTKILDFPVDMRGIPGAPCCDHSVIGQVYGIAEYFFLNPTINVEDVMLHRAITGVWGGCTVSPGEKNVNGVDDFINDPNVTNKWYQVASYFIQSSFDQYAINCRDAWDQNWTPGGPQALDMINHLISWYPNDYYNGMTLAEAKFARNDINISAGISGVIGSSGTVIETSTENCNQGSFIMFSKDNKVNMSDMLGYYASVELRNNSKTEAELFNVGTTFFESSK